MSALLFALLGCTPSTTGAPTGATEALLPDTGPADTGPTDTLTDTATSAPAYTLVAEGPPETVPGVVLLASLIGEEAAVSGFVRADVHVDLDAWEERYPFRYQVLSADDEVLYSRTTPGPVQVQEYLAYYSELSGIDLLVLYPDLGNFPLIAPLIDGADHLTMALRQASGEWVEVGEWSYAALEGEGEPLNDAVIGTETLWRSGSSEQRLDIALVGDGYTEAEQAQWREDADDLSAALLAVAPLSDYASRINIHRIDAVSAESGISYDCVGECRFRDTAFGTVFPVELANILLGTDYRASAVFQRDQWAVARAVSAVPWDHVIVAANTTHYGGFSLHYATAPNGSPDWTGTAVHEFGHLLGLLGDEYVEDICIVSDALGLPDNISADPKSPSWAHWIASDTPLPTPADYAGEVGAFEGAFNCDDLYRPASTCRMRSSNTTDFCPVCGELMVRQLFRFTDPLEAITAEAVEDEGRAWRFTPEGELDVTIDWTLDGEPLARTAGGEALTVDPGAHGAGEHLLEATAVHNTARVLEDDGDLEGRRRWRFE